MTSKVQPHGVATPEKVSEMGAFDARGVKKSKKGQTLVSKLHFVETILEKLSTPLNKEARLPEELYESLCVFRAFFRKMTLKCFLWL